MDDAKHLDRARYRDLFEHAPDAILIWDIDADSVIAANPSAAALWEISINEITSDQFNLLTGLEFQPDGLRSIDKARACREQAFKHGPVQVDWVTLTAKGQTKYTVIRITRFPDDERRLVRVSIVDVSSQRLEQDRYRSLFEYSPDAILIWDVDAKNTIAGNQRAAELWEVPVESFSSGKFSGYIKEPEFQPDGKHTRQQASKLYKAALNQGPQFFDWQTSTASGKTKKIAATMASFPDPERRLMRISAVDISQRESEQQRYRTLFEHAPDAIMIWDLDTHDVIAANPSAAEFWEADLEELTSEGFMTTRQFVDIQPDGRSSVEVAAEVAEKVSAGETAVVDNWVAITCKGAHKNTALRVSPFPDAERRLARVSITDITGQKREEARYRSIFDHAAEAIFILDVDTLKVVDANQRACEKFSTPLEYFLAGKYEFLQFEPERLPDGRLTLDMVLEHIEKAMAGEDQIYERDVYAPDGKITPCEVRLTRFPDPDRRLVRASFVDISENKKAQQEREDLLQRLAQSQKMEAVGQMTGGVAHDFNNLLNVILGNMELLKNETSEQRRQQFITNTIKAVERGAGLTRNMLAFAQRSNFQPVPISLRNVVCNVRDWIDRAIPANINIKLHSDDNLWAVETDLASAESALLNLVNNARDAMPDGGELTIEAFNIHVDENTRHSHPADLDHGPYVLAVIGDSGCGIADEALTRVFEPFYTTKHNGQNSGLGLSMVLGFVEQSGGIVKIASQPGLGTKVNMYFPAAVNQSAVNNPPAIAEETPPTNNLRILLAEDQEAVLEVLVAMLEAAGHSVAAASNGDEAAELYQQQGPFDLLITDIVMPGELQGDDLARRLRATDETIPIIFISGYAREAEMIGNGLLSSDICLMKPVSRKRLFAAIESMNLAAHKKTDIQTA